MNTPAGSAPVFRFGAYELDVHSRVLRKHGLRIRLQEQPLMVLAALLKCPGQLVTREDLRAGVWPRDTFVSFDHALNTAVKKIRAALADDADAPRYIETVPRRGYRFIAAVESAQPAAALTARSAQAGKPVTGWRRFLRLPVLVPVLAVNFLILSAFAFYYRHDNALAGLLPGHRSMVAVLPFQDLNGDAAQDSFADGLTEEAILQLSNRNPDKVGVIARTSAMKFRNAGKSIDEISRELHSDYVIEGTVRHDASHFRVSARLIRTRDQSTEWTRDYNYATGDSLTVEAEIANALANGVVMVLGHPALNHPGTTPDAYDAYLRGLAGNGIHTREGLDRILAAFQKATREDRNCAVPFSGLAYTYEQGANLGFLRPRDAYAKAREAAQRAVEIDPTDADAHTYLADALLTIDFDWNGARAEITKALALNANSPFAHNWNAVFLAAQGKVEDAAAEARRAVELDPLVPEYPNHLGVELARAGRFEEAEKEVKAALQLDPAFVQAHQILARIYERQGREEDAINEWATTLWLLGEHDATVEVKDTYARSGYKAARKTALQGYAAYLAKQNKDHYVSPYWFASVSAQLGDKQQALAWLEKAYDERDVLLFCLHAEQNSVFSALRDEPRFRAVVAKLHIPE